MSSETRAAYLSTQLRSEADKTRRHLERLPDSAWSWKPHEKSSSLGQLASHLVDCLHRDRESAFADMTLHHLIHHRGQLTVYLRLLDVPVASTYGPTADER